MKHGIFFSLQEKHGKKHFQTFHSKVLVEKHVVEMGGMFMEYMFACAAGIGSHLNGNSVFNGRYINLQVDRTIPYIHTTFD